jgi:hypothetical protein
MIVQKEREVEEVSQPLLHERQCKRHRLMWTLYELYISEFKISLDFFPSFCVKTKRMSPPRLEWKNRKDHTRLEREKKIF